MANDKKSSRSFDLDKGGKRSFNLEKKSTRAFDLTKDAPEVTASPVADSPTSTKPNPQPTKPASPQKTATVPPTPTTPSDNDEGNDSGSKKKWLWIVLVIIVLAVLAYLYIPGGRSEATPTGEDSTEVVSGDSITTEPKDSVSTDSAATTTNPTENISTNEGSEGVSNTQAPSANNSSVNAPSAPQQTVKVDNSTVNESSNAATPAASIEEQAQQVIKGVYGNNPKRRHKLGADYKAIQKRVNELMRSR